MEVIHVNLGSPAGGYTIGSAPFFRYILRLAEMELPLSGIDQEALDVLAAIPHAFDEGCGNEVPHVSGSGWRIIPAQGELDWPVLEATPQRLRSALECAHRILWEHAASVRVSPREIAKIEEELEAVYGVLSRAEVNGFAVNVSYVA